VDSLCSLSLVSAPPCPPVVWATPAWGGRIAPSHRWVGRGVGCPEVTESRGGSTVAAQRQRAGKCRALRARHLRGALLAASRLTCSALYVRCPPAWKASGRAANENVAGPEQRRMHVFGARVRRRGEASARELRGVRGVSRGALACCELACCELACCELACCELALRVRVARRLNASEPGHEWR
jgi:hypothetical protein